MWPSKRHLGHLETIDMGHGIGAYNHARLLGPQASPERNEHTLATSGIIAMHGLQA